MADWERIEQRLSPSLRGLVGTASDELNLDNTSSHSSISNSRRRWLKSIVLLATTFAMHPATTYAGEPKWRFEKQIGNFSLHSDFDLETLHPLLGELLQLQTEVSTTLKIKPAGKLVHIVLFEHETEYRRYMDHYFPKFPQRRALFVKDRGPGMVFAHRHDSIDVDLRHECAHALINDAIANVPLWLDEGLAEYFEVPSEHRLTGNPHLTETRWRARMKIVPSLDQLETAGQLTDMGADQYRDAWAWTHFLLHRSPDTQALLTGYLQDNAARGETFPLSRRIAESLPQWREEFIAHFKALGPVQLAAAEESADGR